MKADYESSRYFTELSSIEIVIQILFYTNQIVSNSDLIQLIHFGDDICFTCYCFQDPPPVGNY